MPLSRWAQLRMRAGAAATAHTPVHTAAAAPTIGRVPRDGVACLKRLVMPVLHRCCTDVVPALASLL